MELSTPTHIHFNGAIVPWADANVHVWTEVILRAASVFEGIRGYWVEEQERHYWVKLDEHVARLHNSAAVMRIPCHLTVNDLSRQLSDLVSRLGYRSDVYARPTIYLERGRYTSDTDAGGGYFMPLFESSRPPVIERGAKCCISSWRRPSGDSMPATVKAAANYANFRWGRLEAEAGGYDEAILLNTSGRVCETAGSAVFVVRGGSIITPAVSESILRSITRKAAIDLLRERTVEVIEGSLQRDELYSADEIFLTGTLNEITPVIQLDGLTIGTGKPGAMTRSLQQMYLDACRAGESDSRGWLTPGPRLEAQRDAD
jgi:branched-chain amino acid aminotransferase